ncbi:MAG: hypothetical protein GKS06_00660 [Acidobacteria bacterium]|nr:hypothetical protein [Acidobacteriota bacterium]
MVRAGRVLLLGLLVAAAGPVHAQSAFSLSGFWETLAIGVTGTPEPVDLTAQFNARVDLRWYPSSNWEGYAAARYLSTYGGVVESVPGYGDLVTTDPGWLDLTFPVADGGDHVVYLNFDRFSIRHTNGNLEVQAGRQRVNWGVNYVWNPNDIFNASSFFDITYIEKPGSDALRARYYTGSTSSAEAAVKVDYDDRVTAAGMYRANIAGYDIQAFAGSVQDTFAAGLGWSGQIAGAGFNGEMTYYAEGGSGIANEEQFVAAAGGNYTFPNSLMITTEFIYNSLGTTEPVGGSPVLGALFADARLLTRARWNVMGSLGYQASPLTRLGLASVYNPDDQSAYLSPQVDYSMSNNLTLSVAGQVLFGDPQTQFSSDSGSSFFAWLKGSF